MAASPSHRFGQIVGALLEEILLPVLLKFCEERGLYLDRHGERLGVRKGRKVTWKDKYGNDHDLDFVIEKNGRPDVRGRPVAFIESAWRRYTKHSRAKAQEIQGAVLPIAEGLSAEAPFLGAVLAGVFTKGSLDQLESLGFKVAYLPYETVMAAFDAIGIDARFDETTPDATFAKCVRQIEAMPLERRQLWKDRLTQQNQSPFDDFFHQLRVRLDRIVKAIVVVPLLGETIELRTASDAVAYIRSYSPTPTNNFRKFEILVVFSNSDQLSGSFSSKERAIEFLLQIAG